MLKLKNGIIIFILIICNIFSVTYNAGASENERTQSTDIVVFIDEQPVNSYFCNGTNYIAVEDLNDYGFDVIIGNNIINIVRNTDKHIEFPDISIVNITKEEYLNQETYPIYEGEAYITIDDEKVVSKLINGEEYIAVRTLSEYATVEWNQEMRIAKLDLLKKEFEKKQATINSQTINYPDFESVGMNVENGYKNLRYATYTGEVKDGKSNGFGVMKCSYDWNHRSNFDVTTTETGYWEDDIRSGTYILEQTMTSTVEIETTTLRSMANSSPINQFIDISTDISKNGTISTSLRREGRRNYPLGSIWLRSSKSNADYKFGYKVLYEANYKDGYLDMTDEELEEAYDKACPPFSAEKWEEMNANCDDYIYCELYEEDIYVPGNLEEAVEEVKKSLQDFQLEEIKNAKIGGYELTDYYFDLSGTPPGLWWFHKDNYKLLKFFYELKIYSDFDMTKLIINALHYDLNGLEYDLDDTVRKVKLGIVGQAMIDEANGLKRLYDGTRE